MYADLLIHVKGTAAPSQHFVQEGGDWGAIRVAPNRGSLFKAFLLLVDDQASRQ